MTQCHLLEEATQQELCHHCVHLHDYQDYQTKQGEIYQSPNPEHEPTYHRHTIVPNICPMHLQQLQLQTGQNRISILSTESDDYDSGANKQMTSENNISESGHKLGKMST